jgi:hypothetical protein
MCHLDKPPDECERGARAIFEYHIDVLDAQGGEIGWAVQLRVQTNNEANISGGEVDENVLEWEWKLGRANFGDGGGESVVLGGVHGNRRNGLVLRGGESKEVGGDPVEVTHVNSFKLLISAFHCQHQECDVENKQRVKSYSSRLKSRSPHRPCSLAFQTPYTTSWMFRIKSAWLYPASRKGM